MEKYDAVILTTKEFHKPKDPDWYIKQVLQEDKLVQKALETKGLKVTRTYWDNPEFDFSTSKITLFRTIWDYFHRFDEFSKWLDNVKTKTKLINPPELIYWNIDKHYLNDLSVKGINIPPTIFAEKGDTRSLKDLHLETGWSKTVLKPTVSGAGRHTYKLTAGNIDSHEKIYRELIDKEDMMLQEYQDSITEKGEVACILFNGKFSHSILKKAKPGDFRVQDDFGGSVCAYIPSADEIKFAEEVVSVCKPFPVYARVDIIRDNNNKSATGELELIEPELWFRYHPSAADVFAEAILCSI